MSDAGDEPYGFQSTLTRHILDPLSPRELKIATSAVLEHVKSKGGSDAAGDVRFIEVALKEADKIRVVLAKHPPGAPFPERHALVIMWEKVRDLPFKFSGVWSCLRVAFCHKCQECSFYICDPL